MQKITLTPLTAEAFKPYGDVIETESRDYFMINNGSTRRWYDSPRQAKRRDPC